MAEIEDVAGAAGGAGEHVARAGLDALPRAEQRRRIEVALHAAVVADDGPAVVERDPPVEADHVAAGGGHRGQQRRGARAEVDRRHAGLASAARTRADHGATNSS